MDTGMIIPNITNSYNQQSKGEIMKVNKIDLFKTYIEDKVNANNSISNN